MIINVRSHAHAPLLQKHSMHFRARLVEEFEECCLGAFDIRVDEKMYENMCIIKKRAFIDMCVCGGLF